MLETNNYSWKKKTNDALLKTLGSYIKEHRLNKNKTQEQLAVEAGINRTTLVEFEKGKRSNLITFIQLLRALDLLHTLEVFQTNKQLSPLKLAELQHTYRKRASKKNPSSNDTKPGW